MNPSDQLKEEHQAARDRVQKLTVIGLRPELTPEERAAVREAEQSARAEVKLRRKALDQAEQQQQPPNAPEPPLPSAQMTPSPPPNPGSSTKPEI